MAPELLGSETPRIWTPPLRPLTPETSLGFEVIKFAEDPGLLNMRLVPWEKWLFIHGLELDLAYTTRDPEPQFRFDTVIVIVSRQNGKTECIKVKKLWRMFLDGARDTLATAQDLGNAEKTWRQAVELAKGSPDLAELIEHIDRTNGQKSLRLTNLAQYLVRAMTSSPRGWSIDDLDLDELLRHKSWDAWAAAAPTTLARPRSQIWGWSSAGDAASIVLWQLRAAAMQTANGVDTDELEWFTRAVNMQPAAEMEGEELEFGDSLALFEWSAHPKAALNDPVGRAQANPSLGHGFLTARKLAGLIRSTPSEWVARQEYLCQWRPTAAGGPFPEGSWEAGIDNDSDVSDESPLAVCVDTSHDGGWTSIAVAGYRSDGHVHAQVIERRAGMEWVLPWLISPERATRPRWGAVTWQLSGAPVSALTDKLNESDLPVMEWAGPDLARAHATAYELVRLPVMPSQQGPAPDGADQAKKRVFHLPQPVLDVPASTALTKPLGDGWALDRRKSPVDCAPLVSFVGAVWALGRIKPEFRSVYEDHGLMVV